MTSSKSFRAGVMPPSLSLSAIPEHHFFDSPETSPGRRKFSFELQERHPLPPLPSEPFHDGHDHDEDDDDDEFDFEATENMFPAFRDDKSKFWNARVSSLMPTLITSATDSYLIQRKPLSHDSSPPLDTPPPPPYLEHDLKLPLSAQFDDVNNDNDNDRDYSHQHHYDGEDHEDDQSPLSLNESMTPITNRAPSIQLPLLQTQIPGGNFWDEGPPSLSRPLPGLPQEAQEPAELAATVPVELPVHFSFDQGPSRNSPVSAVLPPSASSPAVQIDAARHGSTDSGSDASFTGRRKLRKESPGSRRRSVSYQQQAASPVSSTAYPPSMASDLTSGATPRTTTINSERRGRSNSINPALSITDMALKTIPIPPIPAPRAPVSPGGSQSPSRGRNRRSWMPGSRSRSNSVEVSQKTGPQGAWIMGEDVKTDYNTSFLRNAEKVRSH